MCIRDSNTTDIRISTHYFNTVEDVERAVAAIASLAAAQWTCLLYTSDAADERSSVDLGGRRLIKKKTS